MEGFGGFVVGDDDDAGVSGGADEEREIEGAGGEGESRDTSTPRAGAEMASYTLEGFGVLQVREELADEGENHCLVEFTFPEKYGHVADGTVWWWRSNICSRRNVILRGWPILIACNSSDSVWFAGGRA